MPTTVMLMRGRTEATCKKVQEIIQRLGLKLNDTKTRMIPTPTFADQWEALQGSDF